MFLFVVIEEDAECSWTSVAGYRSHRFVKDDFFEAKLFETGAGLIQERLIDFGIGNKDTGKVDVLVGGQSLL